jgi:hypothetical protein
MEAAVTIWITFNRRYQRLLSRLRRSYQWIWSSRRFQTGGRTAIATGSAPRTRR